MRIDIFSLFPGVFPGYFGESILKRAQEAGLLEVHLHDIRDYAQGKHRITDEPPYGGGGGMVLKAEPIFTAVESVLKLAPDSNPGLSPPDSPPIILLTPQGRPFSQRVAEELVRFERLLLVCGRYEGVDERVRQHLVTDEISIGDYVLTGGELAAMVLVDAVSRLLPGVLGADGAAASDSHAAGLLEGPHYTRPEEFRGWRVPEVLLSGHDANIRRWRRQQSLRRTLQRRPDLLLSASLSDEDKRYLEELTKEDNHGQHSE